MASHIVQMMEFTLTNTDSTKCFTILVHPDIYQRCSEDPELALSIFRKLDEQYQVDETGKRTLTTAQSLAIMSEMGLLAPVRDAAKDNGVSLISRLKTKFDVVSQTAYAKNVSDNDLNTLGKLAPNDLSTQEKVRFMELIAASLPDVPATASMSSSTVDTVESQGCTDQSTTASVLSLSDPSNSTWDMQGCSQDDTESLHSTFNTALTSLEDHSEGKVQWTHPAVLLLLDLWQKHTNLFKSSVVTPKQAWKRVAEDMAAKGHKFMHEDCSAKFRSLRNGHKIIKDRRNKTGRGRTTWAYFDIMDRLFEGDPAVVPLVEVGSLVERLPSSTPTGDSQELPSCSSPIVSTPVKTPRRRKQSELSALRSDLLDMHKERMELEEKRLKMLGDFVACFVEHYPKK